ncbi:MAG: SIMPL domain-containing protein [Verrucomicrobiota bacterium]|nr:SIMPL domain-containing protein [Verrucomicrobiota bacterium]NRB45678.1 SIMPL domain-containing protein [Verrucomicrobiales bacterium]
MKLITNSDIGKATLLLSTLMFTVLVSSAADNPPHVTVYGTATTSVAIDQMDWKIRISNKEPGLEEVAKAHSSTVQSVLDFLMENDLPEHCIQTSGMEFGEHFVSSKLKGRVRDGYQASSSINFKVTDLSKYKDLWSGISRMKNVSLNGITYNNSKRIKHQNETRKKALLAAKEKAETLAITLDSEIGKPLFIEEERFGYSRNNFNNVYATNEQAVINDAFAPGQIPITVQIKASFLLVTK